MTTIQFVGTKLIDYTHYIDVCIVDGKLKTFLLHKTAEPNIFSTLKEEDGDTRETIALNL